MALVDHLSGSATAVGGILAFRLIPAALGGTLATKLINRTDRRRTMITMDLLRAVMIAAVPFIQELWWVYLWALAIEAPSVVFLASRDSTIPELVDEASLPLANAIMLGSSYGNIPIGAGLFAVFAALPLTDGWLGAHPYALVFFLDALTFLISAYFIARIATLKPHTSPQRQLGLTELQATNNKHNNIDNIDAATTSPTSPRGLCDAWAIPLVQRVLPATAAAAVGLGALFSLGIKLVRDELNASDTEYGILIVLFGLGAGIGLALAHHCRYLDLLVLTRRGAVAMGALVALMSQSPAVWLTFIGAVGFGTGATVALTSGISVLQSRIPFEDERVLAFSAFHVVIRIGLGIAALGAGAVGDGLNEFGLAGTRWVLLASGLLVLASATTVRPVLDVDQAR